MLVGVLVCVGVCVGVELEHIQPGLLVIVPETPVVLTTLLAQLTVYDSVPVKDTEPVLLSQYTISKVCG